MRVFVITVMLAFAVTQAARAAPARDAVVQALMASGAAWSAGNLNGFMQAYENSPDTAFIRKHGVLKGFAAIRAMYAKDFGSDAAAMGKLTFAVLDYRQLTADFALLTGTFLLHWNGARKPDQTGIFTLIFHKSAAGWRIVSDHTSS